MPLLPDWDMQDRYVGDLGDFGKYGLLRALSRPAGGRSALSLGVVWYLVLDEIDTTDGSRIGYLNLPQNRAAFFRDCDSSLFDTLRQLVNCGQRSVASVSNSGILPAGTIFFREPLTFNGLARDEKSRTAFRAAWLAGACRTTAGCDLVFLDPDNGIGGAVGPTRKHGVKYVYPSEVTAFLNRGQGVVVYHHLGRQGSAKDQIARQFRHFGAGRAGSMLALLYHRGTARAFFVMEPDPGKHGLFDRVSTMLSGPWARHFEAVTPQSPSG